MYTLYYGKGAASLAIHAALKETGVPYELVAIDLDAGQQRSPEYLRINPQGKVPTLLIDGKPFAESAALMMMLAERHPQSNLAPPAGSLARAEWYELIVTMANSLGNNFRLWFYPADVGSTNEDSALRSAIQQRIESMWAMLDARLAAHGPYLLGETFSGADLMLTMYMRWSRNMPRPATDWPALRKYADMMRARPSWRHITEVEALTGW
ncbi:glutathione S-transferase family protein [Duganella sp. Root1480D1]|uniref:glutathione S-transferase family protein n=1 Tax=Duganella sp. Root1480D1 TaxID=1736471 RepID=UPI00070D6E0F|nr:glutathione S-transferase family protein [Duganella sp. Root1480D1]KQZ43519.1 glutathione S-transferase [Duganella sp. Root1480D1]